MWHPVNQPYTQGPRTSGFTLANVVEKCQNITLNMFALVYAGSTHWTFQEVVGVLKFSPIAPELYCSTHLSLA